MMSNDDKTLAILAIVVVVFGLLGAIVIESINISRQEAYASVGGTVHGCVPLGTVFNKTQGRCFHS
jgi:hypothetical protein